MSTVNPLRQPSPPSTVTLRVPPPRVETRPKTRPTTQQQPAADPYTGNPLWIVAAGLGVMLGIMGLSLALT